MTTTTVSVLPVLPVCIVNMILKDYAQIYSHPYIPAVNKNENIMFKINKHAKKYTNISKVLLQKQKFPPLSNRTILLNNTIMANSYIYFLKNDEFGTTIYIAYNKYVDETQGYVFLEFKNISDRSYLSNSFAYEGGKLLSMFEYRGDIKNYYGKVLIAGGVNNNNQFIIINYFDPLLMNDYTDDETDDDTDYDDDDEYDVFNDNIGFLMWDEY